MYSRDLHKRKRTSTISDELWGKVMGNFKRDGRSAKVKDGKKIPDTKPDEGSGKAD